MLQQISQITIKRKLLKKKIKDRTSEFLKDEIEELKKHKWIESEKAHQDLGEACCASWIQEFAGKYREYWEKINGKIIEEIEIENGIDNSGYQR